MDATHTVPQSAISATEVEAFRRARGVGAPAAQAETTQNPDSNDFSEPLIGPGSVGVGVDVPGVGRVYPTDLVISSGFAVGKLAQTKALSNDPNLQNNPEVKEAAPERGTSAAELRREDGVEAKGSVGDGIRARGVFDEPWRFDGYKDWRLDNESATFFIGVGEGIDAQTYLLKGSLPNARRAVERLVACVNACAGIPTAELDEVTRIYESRKGGAR